MRLPAPLGAFVFAALLLCGCQQPQWMNPAASHGAAALAPAVLEAVAAREGQVPPAKISDGTTREAPPPPPAWAAGLIGKPLRVFPNEGNCILSADFVQLRYLGGGGGLRVVGWGWDPAAKAPVPRVLLVDDNYRIVGVGEMGVERTDVRAVRPDVTSDFSGWSAITGRTRGGVTAYGLLGDGRTVCKGGHIDL